QMNGSALSFERFAAGGMPSPLVDSSLMAARFAVPGLPNGAIVPAGPGRGSSLLTYKVSIPMGMLSPYYQGVSVSAGSTPDRWHRLVGVEMSLRSGTIPAAYLPGFSLMLGVSESLDAPFRHRAAAYSEVRLIP
ncbi:MAG TPA: hypothetical protein VF737_09415, partial [Gemmatimonadaceae bacterium]